MFKEIDLFQDFAYFEVLIVVLKAFIHTLKKLSDSSQPLLSWLNQILRNPKDPLQ
jgi:hypothetical protein